MINLFLIITISLIGMVIAYVVLSFVLINGNERGVLFNFGEITDTLEPGLRFCPWLISHVIKYEMTPLIFEIEVPSVFTKNGKVVGYKEDGEEVERAEVNINITLVTYFSKDLDDLMITAERAPGNDAQSLGPAIMPFIVDVVRSTFSEMPWVLSYQERRKVLALMLSRIVPKNMYHPLKSKKVKIKNGEVLSYYFERRKLMGDSEDQMEKYNTLVQFRLDMSRTTLNIEEFTFSNPELAGYMSSAEAARISSEAARIKVNQNVLKIKDEGKAEAEVILDKGIKAAEVIQKQGVALADARKRMVAEIKDNPDLEFLRAMEEMAKGTSNTILYQIPGAFEDRVSKILGGSKPADLLSILKDKDVMDSLREMIKNVSKT